MDSSDSKQKGAITEAVLPYAISSIIIPDTAKINEHSISFGVGVGRNRVEFYWRRDLEVWHLDGHPDAFLAQGLVPPEWMPGFPGNNVSSQIVILENDGPRIIRGNLRGARKGNSWLNIVRRSRNSLSVRYTPPAAQRQQLNERVDELRARRQSEAKSPRYMPSYKPQQSSGCCHQIDVAEINHAGSGMPMVAMPKDFQQDELGYPVFRIPTTEGDVRVKGCRSFFSCKGTADVLTESGLVQADWLPGLPGNNSTRQTVAFDEDVPRLLKGKWHGIRNPVHSIIITRLSKQIYEVRVPTTDEQSKFIDSLQDRHMEKMREEKAAAEDAALRTALRAQTPGRIRQKCLTMVDLAKDMSDAHLQDAGYRYNKESQARINRAFSELRNAFAEGGIVRDKHEDMQRAGNVIYLGAQPAAEVP